MTTARGTASNTAVRWAALGACIGALTGMTASPVAGTVIASLIAAATLASSVLGGFASSRDPSQTPRADAVDITPLIFLAFAVLVTAVATSFVRSAVVQAYADGELVRTLSAPPD